MKKIIDRNSTIYLLRRFVSIIIDIMLAYMILLLGICYFKDSNMIFMYILMIILSIFVFSFFCELIFRGTIGMWYMGLMIRTFQNNKIRVLMLRKAMNFIELLIIPISFVYFLLSRKKVSLSENYSKYFITDSPLYIKESKTINQTAFNKFLMVILVCLLPMISLCILQSTLIFIMYIYGRIINYSY